MNFLKKIVFGDNGGEAAQNQPKHFEVGGGTKYASKDLTNILTEEDFEALFSVSLSDIQFCQIKPKH